MMIRKATASNIPAVAAAYEELLLHEEACGTHSNWRRGLYPVRATAEGALLEGTLFVLDDKGTIRGSLILNEKEPAEYSAVPWQYTGNVLVAHTLCIPPSSAGQGFGRTFMTFALEWGKQKGYDAFRLDTWAHNEPAAALYRSLGFRLAGSGEALLQGVIPETLIFFEKELRQKS